MNSSAALRTSNDERDTVSFFLVSTPSDCGFDSIEKQLISYC